VSPSKQKGLFVKKLFTTVLLIVGVSWGAASCTPSAGATPLSEGTIIIDVRTPDEFATGYLQGAINIDVQSPAFMSEISQLDPAADFFIYCRTGSRSGQAISQMTNIGFTSMINGRSVAEASAATGIPVIK
jgi:rhodanese-related sulfurtransferase